MSDLRENEALTFAEVVLYAAGAAVVLIMLAGFIALVGWALGGMTLTRP